MKKEKVKSELMKAGIEKYAKNEISSNPLLCAEAIGFLEACKIVIPELAVDFDELIHSYKLLLLLI